MNPDKTARESTFISPAWLATIAAALLLLVAGWLIGTGGIARSGNETSRGIFVSGEGITKVRPDMARVILGVEASAATAAEAQTKNALIMAKILTSIKKLNIPARDIQTTEFNLFPERRFIQAEGRDQLIGYRVSNQIILSIRSLQLLGKVVDTAIQSGATNVNSVAFTVSDPARYERAALAAAVQNAQAKATALANRSKLKLKKVLYINESTSGVQPLFMGANTLKRINMDAAAATPLEPGNVEIRASVQMGFAI
ncbi:MAG TPA: SIMPL domain-containing protein [Bacillota bacterium]